MKTLLLCGGAVALAPALALAQARTHDLRLLPQNVHWGYYDASVTPVLRVASGDTVSGRDDDRARAAAAARFAPGAVDLHVTQPVDGTQGVHAMLATSIFTH